MTGQDLITEFRNNGFTLFLSGEGVGYSYARKGEPDRARVIPLLEELRRNKEEVKRLLLSKTIETLDLGKYVELFSRSLADLAALDPQGIALRQIQRKLEVWDRIQAAEDEINHLWREAQDGRMVWHEYQEAVKSWSAKVALAIESQKGKL